MTSAKKKGKGKPRKRLASAAAASQPKAAPDNTDCLEIMDSPELLAHATAIRALGKQTIANVVSIGEHLAKSKDIAPRGKFSDWLDRNFGWTDRHARTFMQVFEMSRSSEKFSAALSDNKMILPVSSLYLLAAPSTPEEVRDEIIDRVSRGEKIKHAEVKDAVAAGRKPDVEADETPSDQEPSDQEPSDQEGTPASSPATAVDASAPAPITVEPPAPSAGGRGRGRRPKQGAAEADAEHQNALYGQGCAALMLMTNETRCRFFDHIEQTYKNDEQSGPTRYALKRTVIALESEVDELKTRLEAALAQVKGESTESDGIPDFPRREPPAPVIDASAEPVAEHSDQDEQASCIHQDR